MTCPEVVDRLPWLLNGSLEDDERRRLTEHLDRCAACQAEWKETRQAAAVFGAHAPAAVLVRLAWDEPLDAAEATLARDHLATCAECTEDLALARRSRIAERSDRPAGRPAALPTTRYAALAAGLAASFAAGVVWHSGQPPAPLPEDGERARLGAQVEVLESENRRLRQSLEMEAAGRPLPPSATAATPPPPTAAPPATVGPQPNLPVIELFPTGDTTRSSGPPSAAPNVPEGAGFVALVLNTAQAKPGPVVVEIRDEAGQVVWSGGTLEPGSLGGYTLGLPRGLLTGGRLLVLLRNGHIVETYPLPAPRGR